MSGGTETRLLRFMGRKQKPQVHRIDSRRRTVVTDIFLVFCKVVDEVIGGKRRNGGGGQRNREKHQRRC